MNAPIIQLRGHHLLCQLTWAGNGYTPEFTAKFDSVIGPLGRGELEIEIVTGPDDLCAHHSPDSPRYHCQNDKQRDMDMAALADLSALIATLPEGQNVTDTLPLIPGSRLRLTPEYLAALRAAYKVTAVRSACQSCSWKDFCTEIADGDFAVTRLRQLGC